ncbi:biotin synthase BioB [Olivibacter ginsenosidimutans]|uniref:Biotin synthase n=1 Tax=Olivibacter ginsenosidimutans TaxID=1176537 RepID=A0ABP9AWQ5_9SPHI
MDIEAIETIYHRPLWDLVFEATTVHRQYHDPEKIQISSLISIKTGGCPEDCGYCPQAARYHTGVKAHRLMSVQEVKEKAEKARSQGASRVCLGAAWRNVKDGAEFDQVLEMVRTVTNMDMEVCCTLGMLTETQAKRLEEAGLYAYNHNLDSSRDFYEQIISTRSYDDRLQTIQHVRKTSITLCSGGIIGMGESIRDRFEMLRVLANLTPQPESVPINALVAVAGTPLEDQPTVTSFELIRMIATTRIVLPHTQVRLSAGRASLNPEAQTLCFLAGANSIFLGDKLLTTPNPDQQTDKKLLETLGLKPQEPFSAVAKRAVIEAEKSKIHPLGEHPRWSRPPITIERNEAKSLK